jgi:hypothetical protein
VQRPGNREVEFGDHQCQARIAARSPLLALDDRHSAFQAVPHERYAYGRLAEWASGSPAATETMRRSEAPPFIQRDEALA